ncbi:MAG: tRNA (N(6)-L-threonylcarbamoyladenosine(37)-C(2))-methylthiotransferase MtaB [Pseudomonadota bacterium]
MAFDILTFGCRLNAYESEVMRGHGEAAGLNDTIVVNTCAVTAEAERQARQAIRRAARENPNAKIVVTGCAAQISPEKFAQMPEVSRVIGNEEKLKAETWAAGEHAPLEVGDIMAVRETAGHLIEGFEGQTRAFLQVQNGCDHRCTFCTIPFGRGNSRSVPIGAIVQQTRALVEAGFKELVLTGVDITSYGPDLPGQPSLGQMVRRLLAQVPDLPRLRLSSLDPVEIDEDLWRLIERDPRLMPHLHLSLQAGDDMVLKRMKRRHLRADALALCEKARRLRPDMVFGADLIAGFPTEDEGMFERTLGLVEDCGLTYLHVFPYSPRPGTPAARMPQVPGPVRKERAARLRQAGEKALDSFLTSKIGAEEIGLVETAGTARTEQFATVGFEGEAEPGSLVPIRVIGSDGARLSGQLVGEQAAA